MLTKIWMLTGLLRDIIKMILISPAPSETSGMGCLSVVISFLKLKTASYIVWLFDEVSLFTNQPFCFPNFLTGVPAGYYIDRGCAKLITSGKVACRSVADFLFCLFACC
jgi:hypothetical protein